MLMHEATEADIAAWKKTFESYRGKLIPKRKSGEEIAAYFCTQYPAVEIFDEDALHTVTQNVLQNVCFKEKLSPGKFPCPVAFLLQSGEKTTIFVGIDLETGYFCVEGTNAETGEFAEAASEEIYDKLIAFRGLDEADLKNFYSVSEYVAAAKKCGETDF